MGTWMIHFLFPELKSQHLGEVQASAPTLLVPPDASPVRPQSWPALTWTFRVREQANNCVVRPDTTLSGLFKSPLPL